MTSGSVGPKLGLFLDSGVMSPLETHSQSYEMKPEMVQEADRSYESPEGGPGFLKSNLAEIFVCVYSEIHSKD